MAEIIKKRKCFWPWDDEAEEAWLGEMSQEGYHLVKPGYCTFNFEVGESKDYVYRLDYVDAKKDRAHYLQIFADAGWDYIGEMSGWQYFRQEIQDGENPEIFTDPESKIQKYKRYQQAVEVAFPSYLIFFVVFWDSWPKWMMWMNVAIIILSGVFSLFVTLKFNQRIKQLKSL